MIPISIFLILQLLIVNLGNCEKNCISDILLIDNKDESFSSILDNITVSSQILNDSDSDTLQHNKIILSDDTSNANWNNSKNDSGHIDFDNQLLAKHFIHEIDNNIQVTENEKDFVQTIRQHYLKINPPFDLTKVQGISRECFEQSALFIKALKNFELWALKMHDASAKITSGIFNGNINQYGDFDQCLNVQVSNELFQGKYCLTYLQPFVPSNLKYIGILKNLVQSYEPFKSEFDDPGHRVPRLSTINWALCVPSSCSNDDVELGVKEYMTNFTRNTGVELKIRVNKEMCQVKDNSWYSKLDKNTKVAILFLIGFLTVICFSTLYDFKADSNTKNPWFTAFSCIKNTKKVMSLERDASDIKTAHGIRFFNALMLVISHKCMAMYFNPYMNRTEMSEDLGRSWTVLGRAAALYTDPFIMLSGLLTAYSLFRRLQKGQKINILKEYVGRYLRIAPPLAFLILFCTYVLPLLGSGPQWNLVVAHHATICKQNWWRNLIFIHNYFGFENMCLTHTHHIGIDSQLFLIAPFIVFLIWRWPRKGTMIVIALAIISTIARFYVTFTRHLSNYIYFGTSVSKLFETANYMYILPTHRFTVYAMGILLGYVLQMFKNVKLTKNQLKNGWIVSTTAFLASFFGPAAMGNKNYKFNPMDAANYAAFAPIGWCCFFAWIIFVAENNYKNRLIQALEWEGFLVTTKISYAVYLTQFPVFFYNVGKVRTTQHFGFLKIIGNTNEHGWMLIVSLLLTVLVELPFTNIKEILFKRQVNKKDLFKNDNNNNHSKKLKDIENYRFNAYTIRKLLD